MTAEIVVQDGSGRTSTPDAVQGYDTAIGGRNTVHNLIGGGIAVTIVPPRPRAGELVLFYTTEAAAFDAVDMHRTAASFLLTETDRAPVGMYYTLGDNGGVQLALDPGTRDVWTVTVSYQEVNL